MCFLRSRKEPKDSNVAIPGTSHPFWQSSRSPAVLRLLRWGCFPEVRPAIVFPVPVLVVDGYPRPCPCHPSPNHMMKRISLSVNPDDHRPGAYRPSKARSIFRVPRFDRSTVASSRSPNKTPSSRDIIEKLTHALWRDAVFDSHQLRSYRTVGREYDE